MNEIKRFFDMQHLEMEGSGLFEIYAKEIYI